MTFLHSDNMYQNMFTIQNNIYVQFTFVRNLKIITSPTPLLSASSATVKKKVDHCKMTTNDAVYLVLLCLFNETISSVLRPQSMLEDTVKYPLQQ
jgi:hypothetical protein